MRTTGMQVTVSFYTLCFLAAVVLGCGAGDFGGPSPQDQEMLESFWADPHKADRVLFGAGYTSEYTNMGLGGRVSAGDHPETFSLFAGWHTDDFPWPDAENWVSIGLRIGDEGYDYVAYSSDGFSITPLPDKHRARFSVSFEGFMENRRTRREVWVEFGMSLDATIFKPWQLGVFGLGMRYMPAMLTAMAGVTDESNTYLRVGDRDHAIHPESLVGEVEQGRVRHVNYRGGFFKYEYCSVSNPDDGKSFTSFTTRALTEEGNPILETASSFYASSGSRAFTFDRAADYADRDDPCVGDCEPDWKFDDEGNNPDNPEGLACPAFGPEGVLFEHEVDLGKHASLKRQMFRTKSISGKAYIGLREVFLPKTDAWGNQCLSKYCGDLPPTE